MYKNPLIKTFTGTNPAGLAEINESPVISPAIWDLKIIYIEYVRGVNAGTSLHNFVLRYAGSGINFWHSGEISFGTSTNETLRVFLINNGAFNSLTVSQPTTSALSAIGFLNLTIPSLYWDSNIELLSFTTTITGDVGYSAPVYFFHQIT